MHSASYVKKKTNRGISRECLVWVLVFLIMVFASCDGSETQPKSKSTVTSTSMYYTVAGNLVEVHNTPWGKQSYTVDELPPGAVGGEGGIFVGNEQEPRIKILFLRDKGVVSVAVDGVKVPTKK